MLTADENKKLIEIMNESPEHKAIIEKLIESHRFTMGQISHEIRNPLTLVYSSLQLIQAQHPEVLTYKHWEPMVNDVEFMKSLLEDLSVLRGSDQLSLAVFDISELLKQLVLSYAVDLANTDIEFTSKMLPYPVQITGDARRLKQVLLNLLKNAQDALGENGTLRLEASHTDDSVCIIVKDSGCGIPAEELEDIFLPFFTHKAGGTGLGLAIAKNIVDAHKGTIKVSSEQRLGTAFTIRLPIQ